MALVNQMLSRYMNQAITEHSPWSAGRALRAEPGRRPGVLPLYLCGMPYPRDIGDGPLPVERLSRDSGAMPAVAIFNGKCRVVLSPD